MGNWLKTGTYATMHLLVAMAVAYVLSGSWRLALGIGVIEPAVQTLFYSLHERLWGRVKTRPAPARPAARNAGSAVAPSPCPACP